VKRETKDIIRQRLDDAARYAKQARKAVQLSDQVAFEASLRGARFMFDSAEQHFKRGMEDG